MPSIGRLTTDSRASSLHNRDQLDCIKDERASTTSTTKEAAARPLRMVISPRLDRLDSGHVEFGPDFAQLFIITWSSTFAQKYQRSSIEH